MSQREFPHNLDAERAVIGAVLIENNIPDTLSDLEPPHFYREGHRKIWAAMKELSSDGTRIDIILLSEALESTGDLKLAGGVAYLSSVTDAVPITTNAPRYAEIIIEKARLRRVLEKAADLTEAILEESSSEDLAEEVEEIAADVATLAERPIEACSVVTMEQGLIEWFEQRERLENDEGGEVVPTGWPGVDRLLNGGWRAGKRPYWLAAPTKVGKTGAALQTLLYAAMRGDLYALFFSLEMTREAVMSRAMANWGKLDASGLERWVLLDNDQKAEVIHVADQIVDAKLLIDASGAPPSSVPQRLRRNVPPTMTIPGMRKIIKRYQDKYPIGLVCLDYIQRVKVPKTRGIYERVTAASNEFAAMIQELRIPGIGVAMIGREGQLKGSGDLEQDAEAVLTLERASASAKDKEFADMTEDEKREGKLIISPNAGGPCGCIRMDFDGPSMRWTEVTAHFDSVENQRPIEAPGPPPPDKPIFFSVPDDEDDDKIGEYYRT